MLPVCHGGDPQYLILRVSGEETFVSLKLFKQAALTTGPKEKYDAI